MDLKSDGCRLCLDLFAECFTTINNPQLKEQMGKVFCFSIESKQGYSSGVCQSCSYAIAEFYQYSEKVRQNQEVLNGNVTNCDPAIDSKITLENLYIKALSDSELSEKRENANESKDESSGEEEDVPNSGDDETYEPPFKKPQTIQKGRPRKRPLDDVEAEKLRTMQNHQKRKERDQLFNKHFRMICDLCGTSAESFTALRSHFRKEHKTRYCFVVCCNKRLSSPSEMLNHIDFHANPEVFRCEMCGNKYMNKVSLKAHMVQKHSDAEHLKMKCHECDKMFACKTSLSCHMTNQHSGKDRTRVCDTCGKEFLNKQSFDRHMNEHKGIKIQRLQCEICQRWLKGAENFRRHMNWVHTAGNEEFRCDICQTKYKHSRALYLHKLRMHTEPKHECNICGEKFKSSISLKDHRSKHTGDVLYSCEYCGITKNSRGPFFQHIKRHHPMEWAQKKLMRHGVLEG